MLPCVRSRSVLAAMLALVWIVNSLTASSQIPQHQRPQERGESISARGKQTFASTCAGCHGLDGRGGERAPNIAENPKVQKLSDTQISRIVENGVAGTGMPAFHSLARSDVQAVVKYLRSLQGAKTQGTKRTINLPGDPNRGEAIFFGKAECFACHMAAGRGGFIASDLSGYAAGRSVEQIRSALTNPGLSNDQQMRLATVTVRGGEKVVGKIRNEDNFSLQLQTLDGKFFFLNKSDLVSLDRSQTLMPSDHGTTLNSDELNGVISYLMRVASENKSVVPQKADEWEQ